MAKPEETGVLSARVPLEFFNRVSKFVKEWDNEPGGRSRFMVRALESYMDGDVEFSVVVAERDMLQSDRTQMHNEICRLHEDYGDAVKSLENRLFDALIDTRLDKANAEIDRLKSNDRLMHETNCELSIKAYNAEKERDMLKDELDRLRIGAKSPRIERIPTAKKVRTLAPLSQHTKARMYVWQSFFEFDGGSATSSDIAWLTGSSCNNVSKRIQELAAEGYVMQTGEYRKSRDSDRRLMVWKRTAKQYTGA